MNLYLQQVDDNLKIQKYSGQIIVTYNCGSVRAIELIKKEAITITTIFVSKST